MPCDDDSFEAVPARPRFPYVRVAASGLGFLVATYVWLGWGYRWDVTPADLVRGAPPVPFPGGWVGRYVRVRGTTFDMAQWSPSYVEPTFPTHVYDLEAPKGKVGLLGEAWPRGEREEYFAGRLVRVPLPRWSDFDYLPNPTLLEFLDDDADSAGRTVVFREGGFLSRLFRPREVWVESTSREFIADPVPATTGPPRVALITYPEPVLPAGFDGTIRLARSAFPKAPETVTLADGEAGPAGLPRLAINTTRGRLDGMSLIAIVLAFWSGVFLHLWLADWRRARRRSRAVAAAAGRPA